jgi:hypothetical protein
MSIKKSLFSVAIGELGISLVLIGISCKEGNLVNNDNNINNYGAISDADNNVYQTMRIGKQEWMVENLRTTTFNDGTRIPHVTDDIAWSNLTTPGFYYYSNLTNTDHIRKFGAL